MNLYLIAAFAVAVGGGAALLRRKRRQTGLHALSQRISLTEAEIYNQFCAGRNLDESAVRSAWNEVAETLRVPADRHTSKIRTAPGRSNARARTTQPAPPPDPSCK